MFRRSRFSIRPNVGATGRTTTAAVPTKEAPPSNQESSETPKDANEDQAPAAGTDQCVVTPSEKTTTEGDGNEQNAEGVNSSAAVQRRKRFSIKPKVAPGRPSAVARTPKPPAKAPAAAATKTPPPGLDEPPTSNTQSGTTATSQEPRSPSRRRLSEESQQPEPALIPSGSPEPSGFLQPEDSQADPPKDGGKKSENKTVKEVPLKQFDKVPQPLKPDRESIELSERAKSLVASKSGLTMSPSAFSLCRLLNDTSDIQRLAKAQKLRALLREETHKVKKKKRSRTEVKEFTLDPTKMTMRDLIHYLPLSNPMTSSIADRADENETILPPSPSREQTPERTAETVKPLKTATPRNDEEEAEEEEEEEELMVPQVKVAEDGTLIIDEESLTVEVLRAKGPNPAADRDPIFERGSTTTYSSFRKKINTKPWFSEETDMFFLAISMVGTDFSMICQLFPHRTRSEIKNKFKKEERENSWRIDKAFKEKRRLDIEYFSKLLEKILEFHKNKKKLRSLSKANAAKKPRNKKSKGKKAARKLCDVDEEDEEDGTEMPDLHDDDDDDGGGEEEEEGEKENEDLCNEGGAAVSKPKRQRKRKMADVNEDPDSTKKKRGENSVEQGEVCATDDTEGAPPATSDMSKETEDVNAAKDTTIKPAKLSRGRAPTSLLPLGRKWGKKAAPATAKAKDGASENAEEPAADGAAAEQANQNSSPLKEANKNKLDSDDEEAEEEVPPPPPKPTRYGRVPKPTKPLNYPAKDDSHASGSDAATSTPARPSAAKPKPKPKPKPVAKRARPSKQESPQQSKKPKLVMLKASEVSDEDDETCPDREEREDEDVQEGEELAVFVPASLRSPPPVISEVEETMEELDILANMPDVLGISQDALYREDSCEQNDSGTAEPCDHQLDLLVDVIDFLSAEHPQVTEQESCNEAAQTLLTIGSMTQPSHLSQSQVATQDFITEETASSSAAPVVLVIDHGDFDTSDAVAAEERGATDIADPAVVATSDQATVADAEPSPKKSSPQARKARLPKLQPKPNIGRASKPQPDTTTQQASEEAVNKQVTESPSAPEETKPMTQEETSAGGEDELSVEPPFSREESVCPAQSDHTTSENQSLGSSVSSTDSVLGGSQSSTTVLSSVEDAHASQTEEREVKSYSVEEDSEPVSKVEPEVSPEEPSPSTEEVTRDSEIVSESAVEPSNQDTESTSGSTKGKLATESSGNLAASSPIVQDIVRPVESSEHPPAITSAEDQAVSQTEQSSSASTTGQTRRGRVKPKPALQQMSRSARVRPQSAKESVGEDSKPVSKVKPEVTCSSPQSHSTEEVTTGSGSEQNQTLSGSAVEPCKQDTEPMSGSTDEKLATENSGNLVTSSQPSPAVTSAEDVSEESSSASTTCQTRRGRVKPKPVLQQMSRTARVRPQATKECEETALLPTKEPAGQEKTEDGLDPSQVEKQMDSSSEPVQEVTGSTSECTGEKMETEDGENVVTLDLTPTEANIQHDTAAVEESKDTPLDDVHVSQKENCVVASHCQTKRGRALKIKPKPNLAQSSRSARSKTQTINDSLEEDSSQTSHPKVEPALACSSSPEESSHRAAPGSDGSPTSGTVLSTPPFTKDPVPTVKPGSTNDAITEVDAQICRATVAEEPGQSSASVSGPSLETCSAQKPAEVTVPADINSGSETSRSSLPQRRRPLPKVKPNLASLTRSPRAKLQPKAVGTSSGSDTCSEVTAEQTPVDNSGTGVEQAQDEHKHLTSIPKNTQRNETNTASLEPGTIAACSEGHVVVETSRVAENSAVVTDLVSEIPKRDEPPAPSDVQLSEDGFLETNVFSVMDAYVSITADPTESHVQSGSENPEAAGETQSAQSTKSLPSEILPSAESPKKGPLGRRGRLIKPKPNLARTARASPSQPIQNQTEEPDSGSVQLQPVLEKPVEGAPESHADQKSTASDAGSSTQLMTQQNQLDSSPVDAVSSPGRLAQEVHNSSLNTSTFASEGIQSLSVIPDLSSEQPPSNPDEPFFILSLTPIPPSWSGEGTDGATQTRPPLSVADLPNPHERSEPEPPAPPGESSATAGDGRLSNVPLSTAEEVSGVLSIVEPTIVEPSSIVDKDQVTEKPSAPQEESPKLHESEPDNAEMETPAKQKAPGRRAKVQAKPNPTRTTRARPTAPTPAGTTNQDSELPGPSSQPQTAEIQAKCDAGGKREVPAGGRSLRGPIRAAKKKETSDGKSSAPSSVPPAPPRGKAAPGSSKTPTGRMRPAPATPSTSTAPRVAPTRQRKEPTRSTASRPSPPPAIVSHSAPEVSAPQESDGVEMGTGEVDEINVSQYFLSDIFTEVDET